MTIRLNSDEVQAIRENGMRKQIWWEEDKGKIAQRFSQHSIWYWDAGNDTIVLKSETGGLHCTYRACILRNHELNSVEYTDICTTLHSVMRQVSDIYVDGGELKPRRLATAADKTVSITAKDHPQLWICLDDIRKDNDLPYDEMGGVQGEDTLILAPVYTQQNLAVFENQLKALSRKELGQLATQEITIQDEIIAKYSLHELQDFLEDYFNEKLTKNGQ